SLGPRLPFQPEAWNGSAVESFETTQKILGSSLGTLPKFLPRKLPLLIWFPEIVIMIQVWGM
ncbi:MAG: hypothetical protein ACD_51C00221G0001, partial [uncultured bacterium]